MRPPSVCGSGSVPPRSGVHRERVRLPCDQHRCSEGAGASPRAAAAFLLQLSGSSIAVAAVLLQLQLLYFCCCIHAAAHCSQSPSRYQSRDYGVLHCSDCHAAVPALVLLLSAAFPRPVTNPGTMGVLRCSDCHAAFPLLQQPPCSRCRPAVTTMQQSPLCSNRCAAVATLQ